MGGHFETSFKKWQSFEYFEYLHISWNCYFWWYLQTFKSISVVSHMEKQKNRKKCHVFYLFWPTEVSSFYCNRIFVISFVSDSIGIQFFCIHEFVDSFHGNLALDQENNLKKEPLQNQKYCIIEKCRNSYLIQYEDETIAMYVQ